MLGSKLHNISINVATFFIEEQSNAVGNEFVFAYTINILNEGSEPMQLLRRHWYIFDSNSESREVEGEGVVGQQPILEQGETYTYTSGCCLRTEIGKMYGYYIFLDLNTRQEVDIEIPEFIMVAPLKLN
jgi:ApaG protein